MTDLTARLAAALAGRYQVERELGQGGMATVYLARDLKHDRQVALKLLRPELAAVIGADRFLAEIKTTANLQHPHILPLYDSGRTGGAQDRRSDDFLYYVMPYVEGESLRDRLAREKQLPVPDALRIATEVAAALDYAHRRGVIHRDIKPENILLHDGQALVADFGIALAVSAAGGSRLTETGMSLGTPHYMSPEQAMGEQALTARSDVYALGVLLYELLVGEPPFTGPTAQAIVAKVMAAQPVPPRQLRHTVPTHIDAAVMTAIEKLPADRFATAADFAQALTSPTATVAAPTRPAPPAAERADWRRRLAVPALGLAAAMTLVTAWALLPPRVESPQPVVRVAVAMPVVQSITAGRPDIAISPSGTHVAYPGWVDQRQVVLLRPLNSLTADPIPGSEGGSEPFFSPDGRWVGFFAGQKLKKAALTGGPALSVADAPTPRGAAWTDDGFIVFTPLTTGGLFRVSADGGPVEPLTAIDSGSTVISHRWPARLPRGRGVLFSTYTANFAESGISVVETRTGRVKPLISGGTQPMFADPGYLLFVNAEGALVGARFDLARLDTVGPAVTLLEGVSVDASTAGAGYGVSANGTLAYLSGSLLGAIVRVNRDGSEEVVKDSLVAPGALRFSPDGGRLAAELQTGGIPSIWVYDLARGTNTRLTFAGTARYPVWHPTRDELLFAWLSSTSQALDLFSLAADGSGSPTLVYSAPHDQYEGLWSPDGRILVVRQSVPVTGRDIWIVPQDSTPPREFVRTPSNERSIALSPNGRWLAYASNESGLDEVYVRAFPGPGGKWQISTGGGTEPAWSADGRELFYRDGRRLVVVAVEAGSGFSMGRRQQLFVDVYGKNPDHTDYAVHPSGRWFAMRRTDASGRDLVLVVNWFQELRARLDR